MPTNFLAKVGVLVIVASALIWAGSELTRRIDWVLPYTMGVGVLLFIVGMILHWRKPREEAPPAR